ncbi:MAG: S41 family peptidase [Spirochaetales bacterium]
MKQTTNRRTERVVWSAVTVALASLVLILVLAPPAFAQGRSAEQSDTEAALEVFENVFRFVQENYVEEIDPEVLLEGALSGLFESLEDPYSMYLDAAAIRGLTDTTTGEFGGVGMYIAKERPENEEEGSGYVEVVAPIEDTPAFRAGMRAGDLIIGVRDFEEEEFTSTSELTIDEAVDMLRGTPGSKVVIRVRRGERAEFNVTLERAIIQVPTARYAMIDGDIGYLRIIQFTPQTVAAVTEAVEFFEANEYRSMIVDVRTNPGGRLDSVIDVADLFLEGGTIVGTASRIPMENDRFTAESETIVDEDTPVAVLINEGSASAAEILAGALQDRNRAYLIGETTFGKGSVQQIRRVADGGFRLTMSRYYLPSGRFIDKVGVDPDLEVIPPQLSDEESEIYAELLNSERIIDWVEENLDPTEREIEQFVDSLQSGEFDLPDRWIEIAISDEVNRQNNVQQVYDLEHDVVLQTAVELLEDGELP